MDVIRFNISPGQQAGAEYEHDENEKYDRYREDKIGHAAKKPTLGLRTRFFFSFRGNFLVGIFGVIAHMLAPMVVQFAGRLMLLATIATMPAITAAIANHWYAE